MPLPEALQPYFEKGVQAYTQGAYEYAVDLLTFISKQTPEATEARRYLRLANQKRYLQHPPSRLSRAAYLIASLPLRLWAVVTSVRGEGQRASQLYERLLCLQPCSRRLLMGLAATFSRAGLDDAALATYEEILALDPNYLAGLRKLARLAMKRGNDNQARQCFDRILTLAPNDLEAQQGLRNLDALGTIKKGFAT
jgi:tetratricopeptide (TPR) repeat protein